MSTETLDRLQLASQFVNSTNSHIFLTGKAGTGKTTFLRELAKTTHKRFVVVAPTGIAALNAKGVTIHSQFLLPLGAFLPVNEDVEKVASFDRFYTQKSLAHKHPLNAIRRQVLRNLDLLIIDEVSMLRADVLDAIDYRLKSARSNFSQPFGGVQLLLIGDLFQLSPIVRDQEWGVLRSYYPSMYFYHAQAFAQNPPLYLELNKVFRQEDDKFIELLNNLRNNCCTQEDLDTLNSYYQENPPKKEGVITLTTHNRIADEINTDTLKELKGKAYNYNASISGDFPKSMFPAEETITLKLGAQIMFIKNDTRDQVYFNGKIASVVAIDKDEIQVKFEDSAYPYTLKKEEWENKRYVLNPETKEQEEEVIGTFTQYPIRLAWAITVHKSQGLTFDKAVIDIGQAFAPGQVYVALSRLRSLDGLVLRSKLSNRLILNHQEVEDYAKKSQKDLQLEEALKFGQKNYLQQLLYNSFNHESLLKQISYFQKSKAAVSNFEDENLNKFLTELYKKIGDAQVFAKRFAGQLHQLLQAEDSVQLQKRVSDGAEYFKKSLRDFMFETLYHLASVQQLAKTKTYAKGIEDIDQLLFLKLNEVAQAPFLVEQLLSGKELKKDDRTSTRLKNDRLKIIEDLGATIEKPQSSTKTGRKRKTTGEKKPKKPVGQTYEISLAMFKEGKDIEAVAKEREMAKSTIEGHAARLIKDKKIELSKFLDKKVVAKISAAMDEGKDESLNVIVAKLKNKYTYSEVRMVQAFYQSLD